MSQENAGGVIARERATKAAVAIAIAALGAGACASRDETLARGPTADATTIPRPDGGAPDAHRDGGSVTTPVPETGTPGDTGLDTGYAACPTVPDGPPLRATQNTLHDSGLLGLRVLREQVEKSREVFRRYDADHGGNYTYRRQSYSFVGTFCDTSVVVEHDVVTSRTQLTQVAGPPSVVLPSLSWTETGASVGSHANGCHPAWTMAELNDECLNTVLCQDPSRNYLYVHIDARGLLVQCGYFPINCQDDCYTGLEPLILTADGTDWTKVDPACCPISPEPACCMSVGGARSTEGGACSEICDGMADPSDGRYGIFIDPAGCLIWGVPEGGPNCCGCPPSDAGPAP